MVKKNWLSRRSWNILTKWWTSMLFQSSSAWKLTTAPYWLLLCYVRWKHHHNIHTLHTLCTSESGIVKHKVRTHLSQFFFCFASSLISAYVRLMECHVTNHNLYRLVIYLVNAYNLRTLFFTPMKHNFIEIAHK